MERQVNTGSPETWDSSLGTVHSPAGSPHWGNRHAHIQPVQPALKPCSPLCCGVTNSNVIVATRLRQQASFSAMSSSTHKCARCLSSGFRSRSAAQAGTSRALDSEAYAPPKLALRELNDEGNGESKDLKGYAPQWRSSTLSTPKYERRSPIGAPLHCRKPCLSSAAAEGRSAGSRRKQSSRRARQGAGKVPGTGGKASDVAMCIRANITL
mmetsp:Transcript_36092/g.116714  ORF Transcript_36092/g.116714 Transcript_36092/m.116714 type:complete len:211 (+) Transcript_36092:193-825(+)